MSEPLVRRSANLLVFTHRPEIHKFNVFEKNKPVQVNKVRARIVTHVQTPALRDHLDHRFKVFENTSNVL